MSKLDLLPRRISLSKNVSNTKIFPKFQFLGYQLALLRSGAVKCVAVGTDDKFESQSTQTEEIETTEEWTQNMQSSRTIRQRSPNFTDISRMVLDSADLIFAT